MDIVSSAISVLIILALLYLLSRQFTRVSSLEKENQALKKSIIIMKGRGNLWENNR